MTDPDALALRALVAKYGLRAVVREVTRITAAYAAMSPKYHPARAALGKLWYAMRLASERHLENSCRRSHEPKRMNN